MRKFGIILYIVSALSDVAFAGYGAHYKFSACRPSNIDSDFKWLACNCQNEAGHESDAGQILVTQVVMRRAQLGSRYDFKNSLVGVITQEDHFSWIKHGPWSAPSPRCVANTQKALQSCVDSTTPDHYLNPKIANPNWAKKLRLLGSFPVGNHEFFSAYRGVGGRSCGVGNLAGLYSPTSTASSVYTPNPTYTSPPRSPPISYDSDGGNNIFL